MKMRAWAAGAGLLAAAAAAGQPLAYPGSTWTHVSYPSGLAAPEDRNLLLSGRIEQGAVWFRLGSGGEWAFNTYAALNYSADGKGLGYNNKLTPALGMKLTRPLNGGILDLGLQVAHERRFKDHQSNTGVQAYAGWWAGWDLRR